MQANHTLENGTATINKTPNYDAGVDFTDSSKLGRYKKRPTADTTKPLGYYFEFYLSSVPTKEETLPKMGKAAICLTLECGDGVAYNKVSHFSILFVLLLMSGVKVFDPLSVTAFGRQSARMKPILKFILTRVNMRMILRPQTLNHKPLVQNRHQGIDPFPLEG